MSILKRETVDMSREKDIITHAITCTEYLQRIIEFTEPKLFKTQYASTVFQWCVEFFNEFNESPNTHIQDIYLSKRVLVDTEEDDLIANFLQNISDNLGTKPANIDYEVRKAIHYLTVRGFEILRDDLENAIAQKDTVAGEAAILSYKKKEERKGTLIDVMGDSSVIHNAVTMGLEELFQFRGAFGEMLGPICRTDFAAFLGFAKKGKTHFLIRTAQEAEESGLNVLYIPLEMPAEQILKRRWQVISGLPKKTKQVRIPFFYKDNEDDPDEKWHIDYLEEVRQKFEPTLEDIDRIKRERLSYFRKGSMKIEFMPPKVTTVKHIEQRLNHYEFYDKWIPDVVIVDSADYLGTSFKGEYRFQLNDIWMGLRTLALTRNIAVITVSHSGRATANSDATEDTITEDISKAGLVTKLVAINASKAEKTAGLYRLNNLIDREGFESEHVVVTSCLDIGMPILDSRWRSEVELEKEKKEK